MKVWPGTHGRFVLSEVDSTLDEAVRLASDNTPPFWVLAHRQTAARGRRGRVWHMPEGNFAATLVLRMSEPPARAALRSFVMSLALFRTFAEITGRPEAFSLKWPNDVLLSGNKVAGILLESPGNAGLLAIGVGVNLATAPARQQLEKDAVEPVALAQETGVTVSPEAFLLVLACHFADLEENFRTYGFAPVRTAWLAHAARLGEEITARTSSGATRGVFEDVDADGHLVLRGASGVQHIAAADVYF